MEVTLNYIPEINLIKTHYKCSNYKNSIRIEVILYLQHTSKHYVKTGTLKKSVKEKKYKMKKIAPRLSPLWVKILLVYVYRKMRGYRWNYGIQYPSNM